MNRSERIRKILTEALSPSRLEIRDDSSKHAGHAGARPEGETHFHISIASPALAGLNRVAAHRKIYELLAPELSAGLHALSIDITPCA